VIIIRTHLSAAMLGAMGMVVVYQADAMTGSSRSCRSTPA
jgi:hypothetical protein